MKLSVQEVKSNREAFAKAGIALPDYDMEKVHRLTKEAPIWIHFGAGNIFRGYIAGLQDFEGATGTASFDKNGDVIKEPLRMEIKDGKFTVVDK